MPVFLLTALLASADPDVQKVLTTVATAQGDERAFAVQAYVSGCRGKNRFAFKNNKDALEGLRPTFKDFDRKVRIAALELTACYPAGTFGAEVLALLDDKDEEVKERAYEAAAHAQGPEVLAGVARHVEGCAAKLPEIPKEEVRWCIFALYALGEGGKEESDRAVKKRVADLSQPFIKAADAKLREHAVRNLELCGSATHAAVLNEAAAPGNVPPAEHKRMRAVAARLKKKK